MVVGRRGGKESGIATGNCSDTAVTIHLNEGYKCTVPVSGELFSREGMYVDP